MKQQPASQEALTNVALLAEGKGKVCRSQSASKFKHDNTELLYNVILLQNIIASE